MSERPLARRVRDAAEVALVDLFLASARLVPSGTLIRFGERLGGALGRLDRRRRRVAFENLERAYGDALSAAERTRLVREVYRHLGRFFFEQLVLLTRRELRPLSRFLRFDEAELARTRAAIAEHGSAILVTLHQGHWELLGGAFSEVVTKLHAVMKPIRNPRLNERVVAMRGELGMGVIERQAAVPALFRHLRRGQSVALLCDMNQKEGPQFADFFGVPAATVRTPGILAVRTGKPLICGTSLTTGRPLDYRGLLAAPLVPRPGADPDAEAARLVVAMNRQLEAFVRQSPGEWNWIHPRWKTRPGADQTGSRAS